MLGLKTVKFNILSSGWFIVLAQMGLQDHQLFLILVETALVYVKAGIRVFISALAG